MIQRMSGFKNNTPPTTKEHEVTNIGALCSTAHIRKAFNAPNINAATLEDLRRSSAFGSHSIQDLILKRGIADEDTLLKLISKSYRIGKVDDLVNSSIDTGLLRRLGREYCQLKGIVPILSEGPSLQIATSRPLDTDVLSEVSFLLREQATFVIAPSVWIRKILAAKVEGQSPVQGSADTAFDIVLEQTEDGEVSRQLDAIFADALDQSASDIHFEAVASGFKVRFRIDGVLHHHSVTSIIEPNACVSRLKLLSGMSVTERRLPQDGRFSRVFGGRKVELRVSTLPTRHGESVTCRVLDPETLRLGWKELGFPIGIEEKVLDLLAKPSGLFVLSGPTGSGKTTTLYTALQHLNTGRRKIITVEDPVEYSLDGIEQVQVNPATGLTFGMVLRTTLRHDPDVLMIGEIRDEETAEIACRAALVGRLVLATIHARSAAGVQERLRDLNVPDYLINDVLLGALFQRLEVVECESCEGEGCSSCNDTGYFERRLAVDFHEGT